MISEYGTPTRPVYHQKSNNEAMISEHGTPIRPVCHRKGKKSESQECTCEVTIDNKTGICSSRTAQCYFSSSDQYKQINNERSEFRKINEPSKLKNSSMINDVLQDCSSTVQDFCLAYKYCEMGKPHQLVVEWKKAPSTTNIVPNVDLTAALKLLSSTNHTQYHLMGPTQIKYKLHGGLAENKIPVLKSVGCCREVNFSLQHSSCLVAGIPVAPGLSSYQVQENALGNNAFSLISRDLYHITQNNLLFPNLGIASTNKKSNFSCPSMQTKFGYNNCL